MQKLTALQMQSFMQVSKKTRYFNPHWHELSKKEKCLSLAPPWGIFKRLNELGRVSN
jgi:hypothetical protein